MPRAFLFHVLGVWLLLSQVPRAISAGWMDEVIKLCGRELVRAEIDICSNMYYYYYRERTGVRQKETPRKSGPPAEITPSSMYEDSTSPSEYLGFGTHSRKKRQIHRPLNQQCCNFGCTRRQIARAC
ncbi:PREDICTED: prorelaxin H2-like [Galeopterus variegatus]|uniref:Prorelaxin H2-like n=1 Tax=Galeopterus variegatus TaxID=482537 RepID=A0ABM0QES9_GALVR|nr:PREDICTED: prorelaxin H2-like [Galeopterus variegatus]